ncbi:DDE_3 domain-containing protein [Trichonephila clavipes]|nr:DDE_3 domain-containing protein [Trichonephila clavipes]
MANRHHLEDSTRWKMVGRLESGISHATCCRDLEVPRNVVSTLWKQFIIPEHCSPYLVGLIVWAGFMADGYTDLHVFDRNTLTGQRYREENLSPCIRLFHGADGPNFLFRDDNARPHRTQLEDEYLQSVYIRQLE